jgi:hypothetical protein
MHRFIFYLGLVVFLVLAIAGTTVTCFAASGALSETAPANVSATPVTLNGADQMTTYTLPLTVSDTRNGNNQDGWNLTITSTTFSSGTRSLATTASTINTAPTAVCIGSCTLPTNSVTYSPPLTVPAGNSAPTAVKFFNAAKNTGTGTMTITPTITIAIPANTFAGTYTSTVTIAISGGP